LQYLFSIDIAKITHPIILNKIYRTYDICSGVQTSLRKIIKLTENIVGKRLIVSKDLTKFVIPGPFGNNKLYKKIQSTPLELGLQLTYKFYKTNPNFLFNT